jgi:energy-coupling factor transport system ATP-binding protein
VLRDVDLAGCAGEVVALTGRNGAGKTTLLRAIAGVLPPSRGRAHRIQGRVAYLPQNPSVILHRQTLRAELAATIGRDESTAISAALDEMGLAWAADIYPRDLSGGERQRAAIAAVTVGEPALVLLDEPTRGMDEAARGALARMLERLRAREAAVVMATHDLDLAASAADRVIVVGDGEIREAAA